MNDERASAHLTALWASIGGLFALIIFLFVLFCNVEDSTSTLPFERDSAKKHTREVADELTDLRRQVAGLQEETRSLRKELWSVVYLDETVTFHSCVPDHDAKTLTCRIEKN